MRNSEILGRASSLALVITILAVGVPAFTACGAESAPQVKIDTNALPNELKATSFAPVIKKVAPSVVNIYTSKTMRERQGMHPLFNDPFFRRFFGDDFGERSQPRERSEQSLGSGVIVTTDGYILTASHVVDGADEVKVSLAAGGEEHTAKIIGTDPPTDIAVLKIQADNGFPAITMASDATVEVGDVVLAIGNPFGVGQTVTMGIVSGMERGGFGITGYENFIQTDAAINPGNSGGALVDAGGRLVGINTAILSRSGGFMGVGFAVPSTMAHSVMVQLIQTGKVSRGFLGINIQPLTRELARGFGLPQDTTGVLVSGITPNGAAGKAGMREGDVITEVNGRKVTDPRALQLAVSQIAPGTKTSIKVLRGERGRKPSEKTLNVTLGTLPANAFGMRGGETQDESGSEVDGLDGVEVTDIDDRMRQQFGLPANVRGAIVVKVDPNSNSARAGLRPGDVIQSIDREPVHSAEEAVALSEKAKDDTVLLQVWTRVPGGPGGTRFISVPNRKQQPSEEEER